jgi:hypothetical protein
MTQSLSTFYSQVWYVLKLIQRFAEWGRNLANAPLWRFDNPRRFSHNPSFDISEYLLLPTIFSSIGFLADTLA